MHVGVHLLAGDGDRLREHFRAQVEGAERAQRVDRLHQERRAVGGERLGAGLERLALAVEERLERGGIRDLGLARARHHHRLHPLAAQHRGQPAAAGEGLAVLPVGAHRGEADQALAGGADRHHVRVPALDAVDRGHGVARALPPEGAGGAHLRAGLGDLHVDRLGGAAGDHDRVEAGALHGGREAPAEGGVEEEAGQGRLGGHAGAAVARHRRVGHRAHREDHRVGRVVDVHAGRHVVQQQARREAVAAQQGAGRRLGHRLDARRPGADVHEQDPAPVAPHGRPF